MAKARLNLWPSSCDVAICSALPSRMMPSQVMVFSAPANRSLSGLTANDHRHAQDGAHEIQVYVVQNAAGIAPRVRFRGAQEDSRPEFPPDDVGPLIEKQRQIAIAIDPLGHLFTDNGFACRTDGKRLGQLLAAAVRHGG